MGRKTKGGKHKTNNRGTRTVWKQVERDVKRAELDTIASICGTTRETIGEVITDAALTDGYEVNHDERAEQHEYERERPNSSSSSSVSAATEHYSWNGSQ